MGSNTRLEVDVASVQRSDVVLAAPVPRPGPLPPGAPAARASLGEDRVVPRGHDSRGLLATAALAAAALAVQFVPFVDVAVDAAAVGGAVAEGAAGTAAVSSAAAASGAAVATAANVLARTASPLLGKVGAFLVSHAKNLGRDVGIGIAADLITKLIDRAAGAGGGHDRVASAAAACATGHVASVSFKEDTRDVSVSCK